MAAPVLRWSLAVVLGRLGWFLVVLGLAVLAWSGGVRWPLLVVLGSFLGPAVGAALWDGCDPTSYERHCLVPARRRAWCNQLAGVWPVLTEKAGVGQTVPYALELSPTHAILKVTVPLGATTADVLKLAEPLCSAMGAVSSVGRRVSASLVELELCMVDVLGVSQISGEPQPWGPIRLGRYADGRELLWDPYACEHVGMQGTTGSGKSSTCYTMLGALAPRMNVVVCGLDPSGLLLGPWLNGRGAGFTATGTQDMTRHAAVLAGLVVEMDRRITLLAERGVDKLDQFTPSLPLIWVVLEEFPGVMAAASAEDTALGRKAQERIAPAMERNYGRLTREARKVGIVLQFVAQRFSHEAVNTDTRSNLPWRVTHRVDNSDAVRMLHDGCRIELDELRQWPAGMALVESPGRALQVARMDFTSYGVYRRRVAEGLRFTPASSGVWVAPVPSSEANEAA